MSLKEFIKKRKYLLWYIKDFENISEEAIVEAVLNYGDFDDINKLINILGIKKVADIFRKKIKNKRCNFNPKIKNYFKLYFKKYA
jgi:hypothetical protein